MSQTFKHVLTVDGHPVAILDRIGILMDFQVRRIKREFAARHNISQWNLPVHNRGIGLRFVEVEIDLPYVKPAD